MSWLVENPLAIALLGAIALALTLVVYYETRSPKSFAAAGVVVLLTGALLVAERYLETPREAVERTLDEIAAAVRDNDVPLVLAYIDPSATALRKDVETGMPDVDVERATIIGTPLVELRPDGHPTTATVKCRGFVYGTLRRNGMKGGQTAELTVTFARDGDRWLVTDYTSDQDWRRVLQR
jgi:hypothetical protein